MLVFKKLQQNTEEKSDNEVQGLCSKYFDCCTNQPASYLINLGQFNTWWDCAWKRNQFQLSVTKLQMREMSFENDIASQVMTLVCASLSSRATVCVSFCNYAFQCLLSNMNLKKKLDLVEQQYEVESSGSQNVLKLPALKISVNSRLTESWKVEWG